MRALRPISTQRFDRPAPGQRFHVASFAGVLHTHWNTPTIGYHQFCQATRAITRHQGDVEQAYRRMVFNILSSNRDDHAGQHAYLMDNAGQWRLSPAYDLTFSHGPRGEHYLDVDGEGRRPTRAHATTLAQKHGIALPLANKIIDEVRASLSSWTDIAEETGVTASAKEIRTRLTEIDLDFRPRAAADCEPADMSGRDQKTTCKPAVSPDSSEGRQKTWVKCGARMRGRRVATSFYLTVSRFYREKGRNRAWVSFVEAGAIIVAAGRRRTAAGPAHNPLSM